MANDTSLINLELHRLVNGGRVYLPVGQYNVNEPVLIDTPCTKLEGEVWNYPSDPNGVFESKYGTKLRLSGNGIPAIYISRDNVLGGNIVKEIGIQGNIAGMDTRSMFDYANPAVAAGICFDSKRVDQSEFSKISCCGLASAISVTGTAEIDACTFEKINADGCCIGVYFAPRASYYAMFKSCVVADTPSYGFFASGENANMHSLEISDMKFVRNGGAFPEDNPYPRAALCFYKVSKCCVKNNLFDAAGTFWYYDDDATSNSQRKPFVQPTPSLYIEGDKNRIVGNTVLNGAADAIVIKGDGNIVINNIVDRNIIIQGNNNIVANNIFTAADARIIICKGSLGNELVNVSENRIEYRED